MSIQNQLSQSASLLCAVDAVRNWRAAALLLASYLVAGIFFGLAGYTAATVSWVFGLLFGVMALAIIFYSTNAVGLMIMDEAKGGQSRGILTALHSSLTNGHRLVLVMLLVSAAYLVGLLALAVLLLVCKIPALGPLLLTVVFPLGAVVTGIAIFALYAVIMPLACPAIWDGATTMQAVFRLAAIARQRIVGVVLSMITLFFITFTVAGVVGGILMTGTLLTGGLTASIVGLGGMNIAAIMNGAGFGGGGAGHMFATSIGGVIVWAIALTLPLLVYCRGCCQVYLANIQGIDVGAMETQLRNSIDAAKRRTEEIKAKGETITHSHATAPVQAAAPDAYAPVVTPLLLRCTACQTPLASGDVFCGGCGHKRDLRLPLLPVLRSSIC